MRYSESKLKILKFQNNISKHLLYEPVSRTSLTFALNPYHKPLCPDDFSNTRSARELKLLVGTQEGFGSSQNFSKILPEVVYRKLDLLVDIVILTFLLIVLANSKTFGDIFNFVTQPEVIQNFWNFFVS